MTATYHERILRRTIESLRREVAKIRDARARSVVRGVAARNYLERMDYYAEIADLDFRKSLLERELLRRGVGL